jgi:DNA-binding response OmpR family regulator
VWKILIIDDEKDFCFFIKANLELTNQYEVLTATEGEEGLQTAHEQKPDLILLDLSMPGISGLELLKRLKEKSTTASIPVFVLTATNDKDSIAGIEDFNIADYISKPCKIESLQSKIERILKRNDPK